MAPSSSENDHGRRNSVTIAMVMQAPAVKASNIVIVRILLPCFLRISLLKYLPTPKAINASAISVMKSIPATTSSGIICRTQGPIRTPEIRYPLTLGKCSLFVTLVQRNPASKIMAMERMIPALPCCFKKSAIITTASSHH